MPKGKKEPIAEVYDSVTDGLKSLYRSKIRPCEEVRSGCRGGPQPARYPISKPHIWAMARTTSWLRTANGSTATARIITTPQITHTDMSAG